MPKSQNTTTIRQARLEACASPVDATDSNHDRKHRLPKPANDLREGMVHSFPISPSYDFCTEEDASNLTIILNTSCRPALYAEGRQPSNDEKLLVYQQIIAMVGPGNYTPKAHSNFCTKKQRERRARLVRRGECPGPLNFF